MTQPLGIIADPQGNLLLVSNIAASWTIANGQPKPFAFGGRLTKLTATQDSAGATSYAPVTGMAGMVPMPLNETAAMMAANPALQPLADAAYAAICALASAMLATVPQTSAAVK